MSTPAAAYESPSGTGEALELHLVHLELLWDRHWVRAVEARAAELLRRPAPDRTHEAGNGEVVEAVGAEMLADLLDRSVGGDQLFGRADIHAHEAGIAHRGARDPHVDFLSTGGSETLDDPSRRGPAHYRVVDTDESFASNRTREGIQLEHHAGLAQRLVGLDEGAVDVPAL